MHRHISRTRLARWLTNKRFIRNLLSLLAALTVVTGSVMSLSPTASAVDVSRPLSATVYIRTGPGTGYPSVGTAAAGSTQTFDCYKTGDSVSGNIYWDHLKDGRGYITDWYVNAGGYYLWQLGLPLCGSTPTNVPPFGTFDTATSPSAGNIRVTGWAIDDNNIGQAVEIRMTVGGYAVQPFLANSLRTDVNAVHGKGLYHGFDVTFKSPVTGTQSACAVAMDIGGSSNKNLGCKTVNIVAPGPTNVPPFGTFDTANSPSPGNIRVTGWAIDDNNIGQAVQISITVGGVAAASVPANTLRTDVNAVHGKGLYHGFDATFKSPVTGTQSVCATAMDIGGSSNKSLGCKTVTVAGSTPNTYDVSATTVYAGPNKYYNSNGSIPAGSYAFDCYNYGGIMGNNTNNVWGHLANGKGYVPDYYIKLGGKTLAQLETLPRCTEKPAIPSTFTRNRDGQITYKQNDARWGSKFWGSSSLSDISQSGCGPSAMAMIITQLTGILVTPDDTAAWAGAQGYHTPVGAAFALGGAVAKAWGLKAVVITKTSIQTTLNNGGMVWSCGNGGLPYTSKGHCIGIRGTDPEGKWKVYDSAYTDGHGMDNSYYPSTIMGIVSPGSIWAISR